MKVYLVGGAVRDKLLGLSVRERDWVVVGATPEDMLSLGFKPVGKDFPVFLHPKTYEEYALARTERKVAAGYHGFVFHTDPNVTLEQDLARRDLTINAMALSENGELIDPFNGKLDLDRKILRHVSIAFREDPVRILRLARFAATLPDFIVDKSTKVLLEEMVSNGEVDALVSERVWQETNRALGCVRPDRFFMVLNSCGALSKLFPELIDNFELHIDALMKVATKSNDPLIRFAALLRDLSPSQVIEVGKILRLPREYLDLAFLSAKHREFLAKNDWSAVELLNFFEGVDAFRRPERLRKILKVCSHNQDYWHLYEIAASVNVKDIINNKSGVEIKNELHRLRHIAIESNLF